MLYKMFKNSCDSSNDKSYINIYPVFLYSSLIMNSKCCIGKTLFNFHRIKFDTYHKGYIIDLFETYTCILNLIHLQMCNKQSIK